MCKANFANCNFPGSCCGTAEAPTSYAETITDAGTKIFCGTILCNTVTALYPTDPVTIADGSVLYNYEWVPFTNFKCLPEMGKCSISSSALSLILIVLTYLSF